jgi:hypothetical protein
MDIVPKLSYTEYFIRTQSPEPFRFYLISSVMLNHVTHLYEVGGIVYYLSSC